MKLPVFIHVHCIIHSFFRRIKEESCRMPPCLYGDFNIQTGYCPLNPEIDDSSGAGLTELSSAINEEHLSREYYDRERSSSKKHRTSKGRRRQRRNLNKG